MRILWHSAAPWLPTGYGQQTALACKQLRARGHDVAISAYFGGTHTTTWDGITVYGAPLAPEAHSLLPWWAHAHQAEAVVILADLWQMTAIPDPGVPVYAWAPVDCTPLSARDQAWLGGHPFVQTVAMSEHGAAMLRKAVATIPHGIDTDVFRPLSEVERDRVRQGAKGPMIGICASNIDPVRKGYPEQFQAFRALLRDMPDAMLYIHAIDKMKGSLSLGQLAGSLGISDHVRISDQTVMAAGGYPPEVMAQWYGSLDLCSNCSYGEGFGIAAIEAQACGTPVVLSDNTTGPQLAGPGRLARTSPWWNATHAAWWARPDPVSIKDNWLKVLRAQPDIRRKSRAHAMTYDHRRTGKLWDQLLTGRLDEED